jgi:hypothetical protein
MPWLAPDLKFVIAEMALGQYLLCCCRMIFRANEQVQIQSGLANDLCPGIPQHLQESIVDIGEWLVGQDGKRHGAGVAPEQPFETLECLLLGRWFFEDAEDTVIPVPFSKPDSSFDRDQATVLVPERARGSLAFPLGAWRKDCFGILAIDVGVNLLKVRQGKGSDKRQLFNLPSPKVTF